MPENEVTIGTDARIEDRIAELATGGEYRSLSDCVNWAILLKFQIDQVPIDGLQPGPDPLVVFFESPRGTALLR